MAQWRVILEHLSSQGSTACSDIPMGPDKGQKHKQASRGMWLPPGLWTITALPSTTIAPSPQEHMRASALPDLLVVIHRDRNSFLAQHFMSAVSADISEQAFLLR